MPPKRKTAASESSDSVPPPPIKRLKTEDKDWEQRISSADKRRTDLIQSSLDTQRIIKHTENGAWRENHDALLKDLTKLCGKPSSRIDLSMLNSRGMSIVHFWAGGVRTGQGVGKPYVEQMWTCFEALGLYDQLSTLNQISSGSASSTPL